MRILQPKLHQAFFWLAWMLLPQLSIPLLWPLYWPWGSVRPLWINLSKNSSHWVLARVPVLCPISSAPLFASSVFDHLVPPSLHGQEMWCIWQGPSIEMRIMVLPSYWLTRFHLVDLDCFERSTMQRGGPHRFAGPSSLRVLRLPSSRWHFDKQILALPLPGYSI